MLNTDMADIQCTGLLEVGYNIELYSCTCLQGQASVCEKQY